jgi:hypothetical protein
VALPFTAQKILHVMIAGGYLPPTVKKQWQLSKISQKWFSYIKDEKKRGAEISRARENIKSGIITYTEWVKSTLLMNRINQVNDKEASIELLKTINGKIHPRATSDPEIAISFIDSLLNYYIGTHAKGDVNTFMSSFKLGKSLKKTNSKKGNALLKFFGNW